MDLHTLSMLLNGAKEGRRSSQKLLYEHYFGMAMSVCIRYAADRFEAEEMCNDGFVRAFTAIKTLDNPAAFPFWLKRIMINASIDYYRKYRRPATNDMEEAARYAGSEPESYAQLSYEEKLALVQKLPPAARITFNLYAIEGYSTAEIAALLQTAEGTVRANVAKARFKLRDLIETSEKIKYN